MPKQRMFWLFIASAALVVGLAVPATSSADPVQITSGTLTWVGGESARITAASASGNLTMNVFGQLGQFSPHDCVAAPECTPGTTVLLTAAWNGNDLPGTATFDGMNWLVGGLSNSSAQATMRWDGSLALPSDFAGGTLTAPFRFAGSFDYPTGPDFQTRMVPLVGQGTAALTFAPSTAFPGTFTLTAAQYDFSPTPEPASLILLATGIAGTWATRRRQNAEDAERRKRRLTPNGRL